jgi:hypothetical protein
LALILDVSIQGKIRFPTFPDVVTQDQKINLNKRTAGIMRTMSENVDKIAAATGKIANLVSSSSAKDASKVVRKSSAQAIPDLKETGKGIYISNNV